MYSYSPTAIDLSALSTPKAVQEIEFDPAYDQFIVDFLGFWATARAVNPNLPNYTTEDLQSDSMITLVRPFINGRIADNSRINDVYLALLAPYSTGTDLEAIAASRNITRLTITPATPNNAAVMEGDAALLRRYLLASDRASAGSSDRYMLEAWTVWPQSADKTVGMWDIKVNGTEIHGRRGDVDVVVIGPSGGAPTEPQLQLVRDAVTQGHVQPESMDVSVMAATRVEYAVELAIEVPAIGPSPASVQADVETRIRAAATDRTLIGGEIPAALFQGAAYGPNVLSVTMANPPLIASDPYSIPVMTSLTVTTSTR